MEGLPKTTTEYTPMLDGRSAFSSRVSSPLPPCEKEIKQPRVIQKFERSREEHKDKHTWIDIKEQIEILSDETIRVTTTKVEIMTKDCLFGLIFSKQTNPEEADEEEPFIQRKRPRNLADIFHQGSQEC